MNSKTPGKAPDNNESKQGKDEGVLERLAQTIDPPSREISDDELSDPGANIPASKPDAVRSDKGSSGNKSTSGH